MDTCESITDPVRVRCRLHDHLEGMLTERHEVTTVARLLLELSTQPCEADDNYVVSCNKCITASKRHFDNIIKRALDEFWKADANAAVKFGDSQASREWEVDFEEGLFTISFTSHALTLANANLDAAIIAGEGIKQATEAMMATHDEVMVARRIMEKIIDECDKRLLKGFLERIAFHCQRKAMERKSQGPK